MGVHPPFFFYKLPLPSNIQCVKVLLVNRPFKIKRSYHEQGKLAQ